MSSTSIGKQVFQEFEADRCRVDAEALVTWASDPWGMCPGAAAAVLLPRTVSDVSDMVRYCLAHGIGLVPQGGNTGLTSAATPDASGSQVILSLARLNKIREIDAVNYTMTVEAGCILAKAQGAAAAQQRLFPPSFGAEGSCQIGGILSTNAGGHNVLRYGNTRDLVLGLEVVLADGTVWNGLRKLRKDNTGYDLKQLFIGAEGTLGVITAAVFKLFPEVHCVQTLIAALPSLDVVPQLLSYARESSGDALSAFEIIPRRLIDLHQQHLGSIQCVPAGGSDWFALLEFSGNRTQEALEQNVQFFLEQAFEKDLILDASLARSMAQRQEMWRLRDGVAEAQVKNGQVLYFDVSVPVSQTPAFIRSANQALKAWDPQVDINAFGHAGDGNIHYNLLQPAGCTAQEFIARKPHYERIVYEIVAQMDGSFSAEHGIGQAKVGHMRQAKSPIELDLMRRIRAAISNPQLNPGKLIP
ncbi:FAD-binding oxidoreductase [Castellaniella sp.]|uniref:FAD-binding oxidoreductase n=1 Tax=Castellaniella sp. TaxID=1955812 RepID=UPI003A94A848